MPNSPKKNWLLLGSVDDVVLTKQAFIRSALALVRPDLVSLDDREKDAAILSELANKIKDSEKPCSKTKD